MVMRLMQKRLLLRGLFDNYREATSKGGFAELIAKGRAGHRESVQLVKDTTPSSQY
jgi:hypothetical protein